MPPRCIVTPAMLGEARRLAGEKVGIREIGTRLGLGKSTVARLLSGEHRVDEPLAPADVHAVYAHEPPPPRPVAPVEAPARADDDEPPPMVESAAPPPPVEGAALPVEKLEQLRDLLERLPLRQQDKLVAGLKIDRVRMDAVGRALARHPEAARDVVQALRALEI